MRTQEEIENRLNGCRNALMIVEPITNKDNISVRLDAGIKTLEWVLGGDAHG